MPETLANLRAVAKLSKEWLDSCTCLKEGCSGRVVRAKLVKAHAKLEAP